MIVQQRSLTTAAVVGRMPSRARRSADVGEVKPWTALPRVNSMPELEPIERVSVRP